MAPTQPLVFASPKVIGVLDADVDPDGHIPYDLLITGIDVVIPLWPEPAVMPGERDILTVFFEQPGQALVQIVNIYLPADMRPEFIIHIGPEFLRNDGVGELWYELLNSADNPSFSFRRRLTIDHSPVNENLPEAKFPQATFHGYFNCEMILQLKDGAVINIPPLTGFAIGDRCEVVWRGFKSPNGSNPDPENDDQEIADAKKEITRTIETDKDLLEGFSVVIAPYDIHVKPMVSNASAVVRYSMYRGTRVLGISKPGLVRIDRKIPGEEEPCEP
jgi:hypothetical protein